MQILKSRFMGPLAIFKRNFFFISEVSYHANIFFGELIQRTSSLFWNTSLTIILCSFILGKNSIADSEKWKVNEL